jgi:hypothetical protein
MINAEHSVEWELTGKTEILGENLPQCHFVHHKCHMTSERCSNPGHRGGSRRLTAWTMARPNLWRYVWNVSSLIPFMCSFNFLMTSFYLFIFRMSTHLPSWFEFSFFLDVALAFPWISGYLAWDLSFGVSLQAPFLYYVIESCNSLFDFFRCFEVRYFVVFLFFSLLLVGWD